jgi:hypothetical protein
MVPRRDGAPTRGRGRLRVRAPRSIRAGCGRPPTIAVRGLPRRTRARVSRSNCELDAACCDAQAAAAVLRTFQRKFSRGLQRAPKAR